MPAEWEKQKRIWLAWPHQRADWPGKFAPIPWVFTEIIRLISQSEKIGLLVKNEKLRTEAMTMLDRAGVSLSEVEFHLAPSNRGWLRDCGPIYVKDATTGARRALCFGFNAWAKYSNWRLDARLGAFIAGVTETPAIRPMHKNRHVVLEGGGIEVDGAGSILVTEEWLLSDVQVRNPGFTREDYEQIFATYLGATNTIWLEAGIKGDDTHGHIDDITRFVAPGKIVTVVEPNRKDPNFIPLTRNLERLRRARDAKGKPFEIIELPMPRPVVFEGETLPASYANFLITNGAVLVPVFNDPADKTALALLQQCFPTREVVGVYARDLVWGLGTIHCLTQQEPV
jgi:agmatine deiminase